MLKIFNKPQSLAPAPESTESTESEEDENYKNVTVIKPETSSKPSFYSKSIDALSNFRKRFKDSPTYTPEKQTGTEILMVIYKDDGIPMLMTPENNLILDKKDLDDINETIPEKIKTSVLATDTIDEAKLKTINVSIDSVLKENNSRMGNLLGMGKPIRKTKSLVGGKRIFRKSQKNRNTKSLVGGKRIFRKTKTRKHKKI